MDKFLLKAISVLSLININSSFRLLNINNNNNYKNNFNDNYYNLENYNINEDDDEDVDTSSTHVTLVKKFITEESLTEAERGRVIVFNGSLRHDQLEIGHLNGGVRLIVHSEKIPATKIIFSSILFDQQMVQIGRNLYEPFDEIQFVNCNISSHHIFILSERVGGVTVAGGRLKNFRGFVLAPRSPLFINITNVKVDLNVWGFKYFVVNAKHPSLSRSQNDVLEVSGTDLSSLTEQEDFSEAFREFRSIRLINTSTNLNSLTGFQRLEMLSLKYNDVNKLPSGFLSGAETTLIALNLEGNRLKNLGAFDFSRFENFNRLTYSYCNKSWCSILKSKKRLLPKVQCTEVGNTPNFNCNLANSEADAEETTNEPAQNHFVLFSKVAIIFAFIISSLLIFLLVRMFWFKSRR
ncbi:hypothetical protein HELRODRAFT_174623 [Helobdella robusta]|uniref:LRRCT domain-containing protein n=1 Tax=Helobdella robusta TaxID=6412 RepID=T1F8B1_HELRO|nr:hypothetical protein HELRODRAFT_174623 [Helobdella robusta]ESO01660.1 hypothetical protein HELRODRAFT_174623 [Helobdella robusta]